ncbi:MAG: LysR family transcriptional regulator [Desulfovibrionaceae bacterium]|nr:LysR family transcriptional regulator [Desulfovibrionaceae bacterium]
MDIRKLEAFCKVYELQSFSKAGEVMFLSQPTISSHVANLEDELGVRLFDRLGRTIMATQAGDVLYAKAAGVFTNLEQARAAIEELRDRVVGDLTVGCSTIPSHNILPGILAGFSERYPEVTYTVHTASSAEVIRCVANGDWAVGIVGRKPGNEELMATLLAEDETMVVAAPGALWLPEGDNPISIVQLAAMPWIMRDRGSATREALEKALASEGCGLGDLNIRCRVEGTCESLAHAEAGVGVCYTSLLAARELINRGAVKPLNVPALAGKRDFYLIRHNGRYMFPALKAFVDYTS